jgi:hypothetical protein
MRTYCSHTNPDSARARLSRAVEEFLAGRDFFTLSFRMVLRSLG